MAPQGSRPLASCLLQDCPRASPRSESVDVCRETQGCLPGRGNGSLKRGSVLIGSDEGVPQFKKELEDNRRATKRDKGAGKEVVHVQG
jgi:hypothetical protein